MTVPDQRPTRRRALALCTAAALVPAPGRAETRPPGAGCDGDALSDIACFPPIGPRVEIAPGQWIHHWPQGEGPPVVLIHGASANLRDFTFDLGPRLAGPNRRVVAMDRPGFGWSDRPDRPTGIAAQARMLAEAADAAGVSRPILVGHSFGAAVALAWALQRPGELRGVVTLSGVSMPYASAAGRVATALGLRRAMWWLYGEYAENFADAGDIAEFVERAFRPQSPPPGYIDYVGAPLSLRPRTLEANAEDLAGLDPALREQAPRYPSLRMPVEAIHGEADRTAVPRQSRELVEAVPDGRLTLLPGVGHMAHHAAPAAVVQAIARIEARTG